MIYIIFLVRIVVLRPKDVLVFQPLRPLRAQWVPNNDCHCRQPQTSIQASGSLKVSELKANKQPLFDAPENDALGSFIDPS